MKRTPFRSKAPALALQVGRERAPLRPIRAVAPREPVFNPQPKREYVRSEALMCAYRLLECQHCGVDDGTVCGAHSNWTIHGKCKGKKADDNRCASLCFRCHSELDQGSELMEADRQSRWFAAHQSTVHNMVSRGIWPIAAIIPNTEWPEAWK